MIYIFEIFLRGLYLSISILISICLLFIFNDYLMLFFFNLGIISLDSSYTIQYLINYSYKSPNEIFLFFFNLIKLFFFNILIPYFFWLVLDFFKTLINKSIYIFLSSIYKFFLLVYLLVNLCIFIKIFPLIWFFFFDLNIIINYFSLTNLILDYNIIDYILLLKMFYYYTNLSLIIIYILHLFYYFFIKLSTLFTSKLNFFIIIISFFLYYFEKNIFYFFILFFLINFFLEFFYYLYIFFYNLYKYYLLLKLTNKIC
jgi:hypothetical protein